MSRDPSNETLATAEPEPQPEIEPAPSEFLVPQQVSPSMAKAADHKRFNAKGLPWLLTIGAAVMLGLGMVLLFLLTLATNNQTRFEHYYERLFYVNAAVAALLMLAMLWIGWRLALRLKKRRFGSRLLVKLAAIFALVGFLPGVLIYFVSYQFVSRSIESWFNIQVEGALDAGLNLGRISIDTLANDLSAKTRQAAQQLSESEWSGPLTLERLREQIGVQDMILWSATGQAISTSGQSRFSIAPEKPSPNQLRQARQQRVFSQIEGLEEASATGSSMARIKVLALVSNTSLNMDLSRAANEPRYLQVIQSMPAGMVSHALAIQEAYKQYQERALARNGLRNMYIGTLTLSLFLSMFGAILLAILLGNQLVRPLLVLADGVARVASGDLTPKAALQTNDELGGLTRSFAQMTQQLSDARTQLQSSVDALHASRTHLQTILDNLTAGVIVLDAQGHICQVNPGATRLLRVPMAAYLNQSLSQVPGLETFAAQVLEQFQLFFAETKNHDLDHWQHSFDLQISGSASTSERAGFPGEAPSTSLIARGAALPDALRLLVFDDITEIVSAQRSRAWGEVARRLAHEIKNPLTPIQLSAERLEMKLQGKLATGDDQLLTKSVKTIVDQVDAMKRLVNEFRDYARLPSAELRPLDLNALVQDVLALYAPENSLVPVHAELDPACPQIMGDAQQLRQIIHNLLQNAQDACLSAAQTQIDPLMSASPNSAHQSVQIQTRFRPQSARVRLIVLDEGTGFAPHILQRAFEPYVTTKQRGTGLGLAVVKKIADEHGARIEISNRFEPVNNHAGVSPPPEKTPSSKAIGAQVSLSFPVV